MWFPTQSAVSALAALVCLALVGCAPETVGSARQSECVGPVCMNDCDGADPEDFCDDCNPCTEDANCTPCSALPPAQRTFHTCTEDAELAAICASPAGPRTGCVHAPLTTKTVQIDACFPVADAVDLHAGVCDVGLCVDNPR